MFMLYVTPHALTYQAVVSAPYLVVSLVRAAVAVGVCLHHRIVVRRCNRTENAVLLTGVVCARTLWLIVRLNASFGTNSRLGSYSSSHSASTAAVRISCFGLRFEYIFKS
jgi:hypothetical protein